MTSFDKIGPGSLTGKAPENLQGNGKDSLPFLYIPIIFSGTFDVKLPTCAF